MSEEVIVSRTTQDYKSDLKPIWCPGCGDYGVVNSIFKAFATLNVEPSSLVMVSGIGCSSRLPGFVASYGLHSVHGRTLPIATGIKVARPDLRVIAVGGDGDGYSIGGGHLAHACRRNVDITYIIMNNSIYGLTKGQVSPTSPTGFVTKSTPEGSIEAPVNPLSMALVFGATFVARGFSSKPNELAEILTKAMQHKGFAWIDVISPCQTFNKKDTVEYFKEHTTDIPEGHDVTNKLAAFALVDSIDPLYLGILYEIERPTFDDELQERAAQKHSDLDTLFKRYA